MTWAIGLALLAGLLFAVAASLQQRGTRVSLAAQKQDEPPHGLLAALPVAGALRRLVRNRVWLGGWVTNLSGFLSQAAALHLGSVSLVQPLLVSQLLFSLPLASTTRPRRRPLLRDWIAAATIVGGIVLFLTQRSGNPLNGTADRGRVIIAGVVTAVLVGLLLFAGARIGPRRVLHAAVVSVAAGLCFAMSAVLMKLTTDDLLHRGVVATAVDWPGYALAVSTLLGLLIEQDAFATGSLPTAIAGMTITNPFASYAIGVLAFHESVPTDIGTLAAFTGAAALLAAGVVGLAHSPTVQREAAGAAEPADRSSTDDSATMQPAAAAG